MSPSGSVAAHLTNYSAQVHDVALSGVAPRGGLDELYVYPYIVKRANVIVVRDTLRPQDDYALSTAVHDPKVVLVFANANGPAAKFYRQLEKETATTMDAAVFFGLDKLPAAAKEAAQRKADPPKSQIPRNG